MSDRSMTGSCRRGLRQALAAGLVFLAFSGTAVAANADSAAGRAAAPSASPSVGASAGVGQQGADPGDGGVHTMGIGRLVSPKGDAWVHHLPRVYTTPDRVFIAHPGENLAAVCWIEGDTYHNSPFWALVIDRNQGNAVGYMSETDLFLDDNPSGPYPACGSV